MSTAPLRTGNTAEDQRAMYAAALVARGLPVGDANAIAARTQFPHFVRSTAPAPNSAAGQFLPEAQPLPLSKSEARLIEASTAISLDEPNGDDLLFNHSILCQIGLPRSRVEGREFQRNCGAAWLHLQAGLLDEGNGPVLQPLPYGATPRLALAWISTLALRERSPEIDIGRSPTEFLRRIGMDGQGHRYRTLRCQLHALAACRLQMGFRGRTFNSLTVEQFDAWLPRGRGGASSWPGVLVLTPGFHRELLDHGVPLDRRALNELKGSALGIDIYTWLAYRLHRIEGPAVSLPWSALRQQFAHEYTGTHADDDFRKSFLHALSKVQAVYPRAKVERCRGGLLLHGSPPPVAKRAVAASSLVGHVRNRSAAAQRGPA